MMQLLTFFPLKLPIHWWIQEKHLSHGAFFLHFPQLSSDLDLFYWSHVLIALREYPNILMEKIDILTDQNSYNLFSLSIVMSWNILPSTNLSSSSFTFNFPHYWLTPMNAGSNEWNFGQLHDVATWISTSKDLLLNSFV